MEDATTHMRGVNAVFLKKWLLESFGEETLNQISDKIDPEARDLLLNPVSDKWYASSLTQEIYKVIDKQLGPKHPDALIDFGKFSAERSIRGFLRYLTRFLTVQQLFKRAGAFWKTYNKGGGIRSDEITENEGREQTTVYVSGTSGIGAPGCKVLEGYLGVLVSQAGVHDIVVKKKTCVHKGNDVCSWEVSWKSK